VTVIGLVSFLGGMAQLLLFNAMIAASIARNCARVIFGFEVLPDLRLPEGQSLSFGAFDGEFSAGSIINAERNAV
jgi:hypothetical protein